MKPHQVLAQAVPELLALIPEQRLKDLAAQYQVAWNVSRLREVVILDLLLCG